jgi:Zn-dependent peptidase ImmA (M78 family)
LSKIVSPIETVMIKRIGEDYQRYLFARNRGRILGAKLKAVLCKDVELLERKRGMLVPPFDPFAISTIGKCEVNYRFSHRRDVGGDGSLRPCADGFLIQIDETLRDRPHRMRSTAAHELMHTFFYDVSAVPPIRLGQDSKAKWHSTMEEEICNHLAREFLVPSFSLDDAFVNNESLKVPSAQSIESLKSLYAVSSDIIGFRLIVDLQLWNAIFVKYLKEGQVFISKTQMKSKSKGTFRTVMIPRRIPSSSTGDRWKEFVRNALSLAAGEQPSNFVFEMNGLNFRLDTKVDSSIPPTVYLVAAPVEQEVLSGDFARIYQ